MAAAPPTMCVRHERGSKTAMESADNGRRRRPGRARTSRAGTSRIGRRRSAQAEHTLDERTDAAEAAVVARETGVQRTEAADREYDAVHRLRLPAVAERLARRRVDLDQ